MKTGLEPYNKKNLDEVFEGKHPTSSSRNLKNQLLKERYKERICERCKTSPSETTFREVELHHKDGNAYNHSIDNLELLCPNCHSLIENYKNCNRHESVRIYRRKNAPIV